LQEKDLVVIGEVLENLGQYADVKALIGDVETGENSKVKGSLDRGASCLEPDFRLVDADHFAVLCQDL